MLICAPRATWARACHHDNSTCLTLPTAAQKNVVPLRFPCRVFAIAFTISISISPHALHTRGYADAKPAHNSPYPLPSPGPQSTLTVVYNDKASIPQKLIPSKLSREEKSGSAQKYSTLCARMGDMYGYDNTDNHNFLASSTSSLSSSSPQDEISLFLRQILLCSSSSSASSSLLVTHTAKNAHTSMAGLCSSHATLENAHPSHRSSLFQDGVSVADSSIGVSATNDAFLSSSGTYTLANMKDGSAVNMPSSSFGVSENEFDEYDCESEEGIEALVEQQPVKSVPPRSSSKRSRAAEVHNLSEKVLGLAC